MIKMNMIRLATDMMLNIENNVHDSSIESALDKITELVDSVNNGTLTIQGFNNHEYRYDIDVCAYMWLVYSGVNNLNNPLDGIRNNDIISNWPFNDESNSC